jgi:hypothetical protein
VQQVDNVQNGNIVVSLECQEILIKRHNHIGFAVNGGFDDRIVLWVTNDSNERHRLDNFSDVSDFLELLDYVSLFPANLRNIFPISLMMYG